MPSLNKKDLPAYAYFSVVESPSYWFIVCAFFHPRDWPDCFFTMLFNQHENDLEGVLAVIRKDNTKFGKLMGLITIYHHNFLAYVRMLVVSTQFSGRIPFETITGINRPVIWQESKGHGIKALSPNSEIKESPHTTIVAYVPHTNAKISSDSEKEDRIHYKLIDIFSRGRAMGPAIIGISLFQV